jgi:general secretion pathway protein G
MNHIGPEVGHGFRAFFLKHPSIATTGTMATFRSDNNVPPHTVEHVKWSAQSMRTRMKGRKGPRPGFTLVEILIVVIILGILAAIVIPQWSGASTQARVGSIQTTLQSLRGQLDLYKLQHSDTPPPVTSLWSLMTTWTDTTGNTTAAANTTLYPNGPYYSAVPRNPLNGQSAVGSNVTSTGEGWYYTVNGTSYAVYARDTNGNTLSY